MHVKDHDTVTTFIKDLDRKKEQFHYVDVEQPDFFDGSNGFISAKGSFNRVAVYQFQRNLEISERDRTLISISQRKWGRDVVGRTLGVMVTTTPDSMARMTETKGWQTAEGQIGRSRLEPVVFKSMIDLFLFGIKDYLNRYWR